MELYQVLQKTPFSIKYHPLKPFQPIAEYQIQMAEYDLKFNKTHYYEHAVKAKERFYYPRELAERIVAYWQKRYPFAQYKLQKRRRTQRAVDGDYCDCKQKHTQVNEIGRLVCAFCHRPRR